VRLKSRAIPSIKCKYPSHAQELSLLDYSLDDSLHCIVELCKLKNLLKKESSKKAKTVRCSLTYLCHHILHHINVADQTDKFMYSHIQFAWLRQTFGNWLLLHLIILLNFLQLGQNVWFVQNSEGLSSESQSPEVVKHVLRIRQESDTIEC